MTASRTRGKGGLERKDRSVGEGTDGVLVDESFALFSEGEGEIFGPGNCRIF